MFTKTSNKSKSKSQGGKPADPAILDDIPDGYESEEDKDDTFDRDDVPPAEGSMSLAEAPVKPSPPKKPRKIFDGSSSDEI